MAKKIKDEKGRTYIQKKPFYKKWWFWLIIVIIIAATFGGSKEAEKTTNNSITNASSSEITKNNSSETQKSSETKTSSNVKQTESVPTEYKSALTKAKVYSDTMFMSKQGIYDQLTSEYGEKFSPEAGQYAIDNLKTDYNRNALKKAETYQSEMAMSPDAIMDQLTSEHGEKFTQEEAQYAIDNLPKKTTQTSGFYLLHGTIKYEHKFLFNKKRTNDMIKYQRSVLIWI